MANAKFYGTGRRKSSIARVYLVPGTGKITINKKDGNGSSQIREQIQFYIHMLTPHFIAPIFIIPLLFYFITLPDFFLYISICNSTYPVVYTTYSEKFRIRFIATTF